MEQKPRTFIDDLKALHYKMMGLLDMRDYQKAKNLLIEYSDLSKDVNEMKTLLIITKGFKFHDELGKVRQNLLNVFEDKMLSYKQERLSKGIKNVYKHH